MRIWSNYKLILDFFLGHPCTWIGKLSTYKFNKMVTCSRRWIGWPSKLQCTFANSKHIIIVLIDISTSTSSGKWWWWKKHFFSSDISRPWTVPHFLLSRLFQYFVKTLMILIWCKISRQFEDCPNFSANDPANQFLCPFEI